MKPNITRTTHQNEVLLMPAENKILQFDRNQILNRYWALANLDSELTKGNITGQLKALDSLCEELAQTQAGKPRQTPHTLDIYQSEWLRKES
jgi:hypothetical protein